MGQGAVSRRLRGLYWKDPLGGSRLSELSRTVFAPNGHDSGEVSGPVAIRFLSHQQQAAATLCRRFGGGARGVLGGAESVDCYENSDGIDLPHVADEIVRLLVAADLDDAHFRPLAREAT